MRKNVSIYLEARPRVTQDPGLGNLCCHRVAASGTTAHGCFEEQETPTALRKPRPKPGPGEKGVLAHLLSKY